MTISSVFIKNFYSGAVGALILGAGPLAAARATGGYIKSALSLEKHPDVWYEFVGVIRNGVRLTKAEIRSEYPHLVAKGQEKAIEAANTVARIVQAATVIGVYASAYLASLFHEVSYEDDRRATFIGTAAAVGTAVYCFSKDTPLFPAIALIMGVGALVSGGTAVALPQTKRDDRNC